MMGRTIIIGDIHGCFFELMDLLDQLSVSQEDRIICVGDLIAKGPGNRQVLEFVRQGKNCESVLGNHEYLLLQHYHGKPVELEPAHVQTITELGKDFGDYIDWISKMPSYIDLGSYLVVHAGIRPGIPMDQQSIIDLTSLRTLDGPETGTPWFKSYEGEKVVIFGHWVFGEPMIQSNAIGIDTGCVYGGRLTSIILPERRFVSIQARRSYARKGKGLGLA